MATSRTGTAAHKAWRRKVLRRDQSSGVTHCPLCRVELDYEVSRQPNSAEPDHIIPFANGGKDTIENGRTICRQCNQRRGNKADPRPRVTAPNVSTLASW